MLNPVHRIRRAIVIVKYQWKPLYMVQEVGPKIPDEFLSGVGLQPPRCQTLQIDKQGNPEQHENCELQSSSVRPGCAAGEPIWKRLSSQNAVNNNLQGQWIQES